MQRFFSFFLIPHCALPGYCNLLLLCLGSWAAWKTPLGLAGNRAPAGRERAFGLTLDSTVQGTWRGGCPPPHPRQVSRVTWSINANERSGFLKMYKSKCPLPPVTVRTTIESPVLGRRTRGGGSSHYSRKCAEWKKHIEGFAIVFPDPLSRALVLSVLPS